MTTDKLFTGHQQESDDLYYMKRGSTRTAVGRKVVDRPPLLVQWAIAILVVSLSVFLASCTDKHAGLTSSDAREAVASDLCPADPQLVLEDLIVSRDSFFWRVYVRSNDSIHSTSDITDSQDITAYFNVLHNDEGTVIEPGGFPSDETSARYRQDIRASTACAIANSERGVDAPGRSGLRIEVEVGT